MTELNIMDAVLRNENTTDEQIRNAFNGGQIEVQKMIARRKNIPDDVGVKLATSEYVSVRLELAGNPHADVNLLKMMMDDKEIDVRSAVFQNNNADGEILMRASKDISSKIRHRAAYCSQSTPEVIRKLARQKDWDVSYAAAEREDLPIDEMDKIIASGEECGATVGIFNNPNLTKDHLIVLLNVKWKSHNGSHLVARSKKADDDVLRSISVGNDSSLARYIWENGNVSEETIVKISYSPHQYVRRTVAGCEKLPAWRLDEMADDLCEAVREEVASNKSTSMETIDRMAARQTEIEDVLEAILSRLDLSDKSLIILLSKGISSWNTHTNHVFSNISEETIEIVLGSFKEEVGTYWIAKNENANPSHLACYYFDNLYGKNPHISSTYNYKTSMQFFSHKNMPMEWLLDMQKNDRILESLKSNYINSEIEKRKNEKEKEAT
jgi:hypothetical protein